MTVRRFCDSHVRVAASAILLKYDQLIYKHKGGGIDEDFENFVTFLANLRNRLNQMGVNKGLSITLPASYWYLRGFDIVNLEKYVDFFNVMTYDIREHNIPDPFWQGILG